MNNKSFWSEIKKHFYKFHMCSLLGLKKKTSKNVVDTTFKFSFIISIKCLFLVNSRMHTVFSYSDFTWSILISSQKNENQFAETTIISFCQMSQNISIAFYKDWVLIGRIFWFHSSIQGLLLWVGSKFLCRHINLLLWNYVDIISQ